MGLPAQRGCRIWRAGYGRGYFWTMKESPITKSPSPKSTVEVALERGGFCDNSIDALKLHKKPPMRASNSIPSSSFLLYSFLRTTEMVPREGFGHNSRILPNARSRPRLAWLTADCGSPQAPAFKSLRKQSILLSLVPGEGFEPSRPWGWGILSPLCLPFHHPGTHICLFSNGASGEI